MLFSLLLVIAGLALLYLGAEWLVKGAVGLSLKLGVSRLVIGLTVVAFGTSMPELVVSVLASLRGSPDITLGNIIGSNSANIGLILAVAAIITPLRVHVSTLRREVPIALASACVFAWLCWTGSLSRLDGALLSGALVAYVIFSYVSSRKETAVLSADVQEELKEAIPESPRKAGVNILLLVTGLATLAGGAELMVRGSSDIARAFGLSEKLIGLTIVAIGTSLPELATSVVAAAKKEADIAVGNVVGSNIFNILGIGGVAALITEVTGADRFVMDAGVMILFSLFLLPVLYTGQRISRTEGVILLVGYVSYLVWLGSQ